MKKNTAVADLKMTIQQLEYKQAREWPLLKEQFLITYEGLKPLNVLKNAFKDVTSAPDFKDDLLGATIGVTAGFLSKALIIGVSHNPIKKLIGSLLEVGISNMVAKNSDTLKSVAGKVAAFFAKKREPEDSTESDISQF